MGRDGVWADEKTSGVLAGSVPGGTQILLVLAGCRLEGAARETRKVTKTTGGIEREGLRMGWRVNRLGTPLACDCLIV